MEASQAPPQETPSQPEPQGEPAPDPMARMGERFDALESRIDEKLDSAVRDGVAQALGQPTPEQPIGMEGNYPPSDPAFYGDPGMDPSYAGQQYQQQQQPPQPQFDQYGNPIQPGYADPGMDPRMAGVADPQANPMAALNQMLDQRLSPVQEQLQVMRIESDAQQLQAEFPELSEPKVAKELMSDVNQAAAQIGRPDLAIQPGFVKLVHQARKASATAAGEVPATGEGPELEGGGGAVQAEPETNPADDILGVSRGGLEGPKDVFGLG